MRVLIKIVKLLGLVLGLSIAVLGYFAVEYYYRVSQLPAPKRVPATITAASKDEVLLFALGDSGTGNRAQHAVAKAMEASCRRRKPDAILLLGDVVYRRGVVSAEDEQWQSKVFSVYGSECLRSIPIYPVLGNHDYDGNIVAWYEMDALHPRWHFPHRHYSVVFPPIVTLYALDSNYPVGIKPAIEALGQAKTSWQVALGHHPIISANPSRGGDLQGWWLKRLLCNTVDVYLSGHSHHIEYREIDNCALSQYLSGAGGAGLYAINPERVRGFAAAEYAYLEIEFSRTAMHARFIAHNGQLLFEKQTPR